MRIFSHGFGLIGLVLASVALAPDTGSGSGPIDIGATVNDPPNGDFVGKEKDILQQTSALPASDDSGTATTVGYPAIDQLDGDGGHAASTGQMSG